MKRVVVVTGASSGIGKASAERLMKEGFGAVMNGRSLEAGAGFELEPREHEPAGLVSGAGSAVVSTADLLLPDTPGALLDTALDSYGRVDYLFVNAGIIESATIATSISKICVS